MSPLPTPEESLNAYRLVWPEGLIPYAHFDREFEAKTVHDIEAFLKTYPRGEGLERTCKAGHITGSALVVNPSLDRVLLMLHAKLNKWLQLGGHVDGNPDIAGAALREAREESGRDEVTHFAWESVLNLAHLAPSPLDLDIHEIPARGQEPGHFHYDIRYLCVLDDTLTLIKNSESKDLRWLSLEDAARVTSEKSMLRQFAKLLAIRERAEKTRC
ncbi:MAG: NUDIX hydrolase [Chitinophagaceae bacterium]|nr:NUDIX hydrolase [Oligoflexus sp.]